jgi:predicted transcriptional regulator
MTIKARKTITKELYEIIKNMHQSGTLSINKIANTVGLCRQTVAKQIKNIESNLAFRSAAEKQKEKYKIKNNINQPIDQTLFNSVATNNSLIQKELRSIVEERYSIQISQSSISRRLSKMRLTRKRLTFVPQD